VTEAEWLACGDPEPMLEFLRGWASDRKLRLFAVACCRKAWAWLAGHEKFAVIAVEEYAEGNGRIPLTDTFRHNSLVCAVCSPNALSAAYRTAVNASAAVATTAKGYAPQADPEEWRVADAAETQGQSALMRCIFGNPFRPVAADPRWLTSPVLDLARAMYDGRDFGPMTVLADALEEAGCGEPDVLAHCRGDGPHARGCWVVDLVVGKT